jgi:hypothetical protein
MQDKTLPHFKKIQPNLQKVFETHATAAGWPERVTKQVKVEMRDNKVYLNYDESLKKEIDNLEYGNKHVKPKPAIRKFTANIQTELSDAAASKVLDILSGLL